MDYSGFYDWLMCEKTMSRRAAKDVISRLKRVQSILKIKDAECYSLQELNSAPAFQDCSMFIKSQLRRTITLYNEFSVHQ